MNPKRFLLSFLNHSFLVKDGRLYFIKENKFIPGEKISKLENYFFRGYTISRRMKYISFVKNVIIDLNDWNDIKEIDCLSSLLPNSCYLIEGKIFEAKGRKRGKYITNFYDLADDYEEYILRKHGTNLSKSYDSCLEKLSYKAEHYWNEHNIGFMWFGLDFYLTTRVEPYILYERKNGKYYRFGEAVIGIKLEINGNNVSYEKPCIINSYSHPALAKEDKSFQTICNGDFQYASLMKDKQNGIFFRAMLHKASSLLKKGYFSAGGAWKSLEDPIFSSLEIEAYKCKEVTNL